MWKVMATDDQVRVSPRTGRMLDRGGAGVGETPGVVELAAARNEYVSFQLTVGPLAAGERPFRFRFSDLVGPKGGGASGGPVRLSERNFEPYVTWFIKAGGGASERPGRGRRQGAGGDWYPEVLLPIALTDGVVPAPFKANAVPGQRFQTVWVDLFVPPEAEPGTYTGRVTVSDGKAEREVGLRLTVLPLAIPDECSILCDLNNYADGISAGWPDLAADLNRHRTARYRRIEAGFFRAAHEHRTLMHYLPYLHSGHIPPTFAPELEGQGARKRVRSWADYDRHFGPYLDGTAFSGTRRGSIPVPRFWLPLNLTWPADFTLFGRKGYETEWRTVGRQIVDHFRRKNWTRTSFDMFLNHKQRYRFFPWDCEEVRFPADNAIHYTFRDLWRGTYDWPNTKPVKFTYTLGVTWLYGIDTVSPMRDFIEVWVGSPGGEAEYHDQTADILARGQEIWMCGSAPAIHEPVTALNWWPLTTWMRGVDGFMAWLSLGWGDDPWVAPPGDGHTTLFYPGARFGLDGPAVSRRLKVIRNAMQTVERLELASAKAGRGSAEEAVNWALGLKGLEALLSRRAQYPPGEPPAGTWAAATAASWRAMKAAAAQLAVTGTR